MMSRRFHFGMISLIPLATTSITNTSISFNSAQNGNDETINNQKKWVFDTKGFPTHIDHVKTLPPHPNWTKPLILSGVGLRRKNLYLFEVDVYMTGISLLPDTIELLQQSNDASMTFSKAILLSQQLQQQNSLNGQPVALITCHFVRDVGLSSIIDAFQTSFAGLPPDDVHEFSKQLSAAVGTNGVKKDDEVIFAWLHNGGMKILLNGVVGGRVNNPLVEERLIETYVDAKRTVSPQLVESLRENISKIPIK